MFKFNEQPQPQAFFFFENRFFVVADPLLHDEIISGKRLELIVFTHHILAGFIILSRLAYVVLKDTQCHHPQSERSDGHRVFAFVASFPIHHPSVDS